VTVPHRADPAPQGGLVATAPTLSVGELQILRRVNRALSARESGPRYQLERKDERIELAR
jgi:hypothetical protein